MSESTSDNSGLGFFKLRIFYSWDASGNAFSNRRLRMVSGLQLNEPHVLTK